MPILRPLEVLRTKRNTIRRSKTPFCRERLKGFSSHRSFRRKERTNQRIGTKEVRQQANASVHEGPEVVVVKGRWRAKLQETGPRECASFSFLTLAATGHSGEKITERIYAKRLGSCELKRKKGSRGRCSPCSKPKEHQLGHSRMQVPATAQVGKPFF